MGPEHTAVMVAQKWHQYNQIHSLELFAWERPYWCSTTTLMEGHQYPFKKKL